MSGLELWCRKNSSIIQRPLQLCGGLWINQVNNSYKKKGDFFKLLLTDKAGNDFNEGRQHGHKDDAEDDQHKVLFNERDVAKEITGQDIAADPGGRGGHAVEYERQLVHVADAGRQGRKGAEDRKSVV